MRSHLSYPSYAVASPLGAAAQKAEPPKAKPMTFSGKVSPDLGEQFRDAASRNGTNANALIVQFIADYVAAKV